jgi:hypothetical protein
MAHLLLLRQGHKQSILRPQILGKPVNLELMGLKERRESIMSAAELIRFLVVGAHLLSSLCGFLKISLLRKEFTMPLFRGPDLPTSWLEAGCQLQL